MHFKVLVIDVIQTAGELIVTLTYEHILFHMFLLLIDMNMTISIFSYRNLIKLLHHPPEHVM